MKPKQLNAETGSLDIWDQFRHVGLAEAMSDEDRKEVVDAITLDDAQELADYLELKRREKERSDMAIDEMLTTNQGGTDEITETD